jgi:ribosomal protein S30
MERALFISIAGNKILIQANKAVKMTPRIPPKNGGTFTPGQVIRLEFPAQVSFYCFL